MYMLQYLYTYVCFPLLQSYNFVFIILSLESYIALFFYDRDMFPILQSPKATAALENLLVQHVKSLDGVNAVVALESRGFLLAPLISTKLGLPLIPIRKKGKLPGKIRAVEYALEYGTVSY